MGAWRNSKKSHSDPFQLYSCIFYGPSIFAIWLSCYLTLLIKVPIFSPVILEVTFIICIKFLYLFGLFLFITFYFIPLVYQAMYQYYVILIIEMYTMF